MTIRGSIVALVTPFHNGTICWESWDSLLDLHMNAGTHGVLVAGTTGEAATMSESEYTDLLRKTRDRVGDTMSLLAGTGSNSTEATIARTRLAASLGAQVALVVTPYYNKPTQRWLVSHFRAVADASPIPVLLYNVPSRTGVNMLPPAVLELAAHPNIIGIKEASGSCSQAADILKRCPSDFILLSGDDKINLPLMALGARGAISVVANVAPHKFARFMDEALDGNWDEARRLYFDLLELADALFIETNPSPAKCALHLMGHISSDAARAPLYPVEPETKAALSAILKGLGLL